MKFKLLLGKKEKRLTKIEKCDNTLFIIIYALCHTTSNLKSECWKSGTLFEMNQGTFAGFLKAN